MESLSEVNECGVGNGHQYLAFVAAQVASDGVEGVWMSLCVGVVGKKHCG